MPLEYPEDFLDEDQWHEFIREQLPTLDRAWRQRKYEQYQNLLALYDLSYDDYRNKVFLGVINSAYMSTLRRTLPKSICDDIASVQPMSETVDNVIKFKTKKSQDNH